MKSYVGSKLEEGASQVGCPVPNCFGMLDPEHCKEILTFEAFVRWGKLLCESTIVATQKFYCPFKDCSVLLLVDDESETTVTRSECPSCFRLFCAKCKVGWHHGIECAMYQTLSKDEREGEGVEQFFVIVVDRKDVQAFEI
ncbi:E3 ubiquitin-protein ligase RSL1-like [Spinacia oleracea]|uniref:RBR-type E3 ubiquitin transferase n=1 Tax=Spinacia oleracea TaxID=3562 RepID=A0A9R0K7F0_SPIOL|nr:E3 ubiquitin-protein ligase RSL1-like [Spinacia oleracea]